MLVNVQTQSKTITYEGCIIQIYFFTLLVGMDNFFLTVMAYDGFVTICHTLHYIVIMKPWLCGLLVLGVLDHKYPDFLITKLHGIVDVLLHRGGNPTLLL
jgi:olfactory receptor